MSELTKQHPEFLEGEEAYAAAPVGTQVRQVDNATVWQKYDGVWATLNHEFVLSDVNPMYRQRRVVSWGQR